METSTNEKGIDVSVTEAGVMWRVLMDKIITGDTKEIEAVKSLEQKLSKYLDALDSCR